MDRSDKSPTALFIPLTLCARAHLRTRLLDLNCLLLGWMMHFSELQTIVGDLDFIVAICVAAAAGFMRGYVGVGSGMLMAPVFAILFGPLETVVMVILLDLAVTAQLLPSVYRLIEWRVVIPMGLAAAAFMPVGTWLLITVDADLMARGIALVVLIFVLLLMTGWRYQREKRLGVTLCVGSLSGILVAATSLGNPPVILYLLSSSDTAATNRANFTGYFAITLITLLSMMIARDLVIPNAVVRAVIILPVFALGAWIGTQYFRKSNDKTYRQVALGLLLCVAVLGFVR
jgi:uncharacterized membrane protein YfcA